MKPFFHIYSQDPKKKKFIRARKKINLLKEHQLNKDIQTWPKSKLVIFDAQSPTLLVFTQKHHFVIWYF